MQIFIQRPIYMYTYILIFYIYIYKDQYIYNTYIHNVVSLYVIKTRMPL